MPTSDTGWKKKYLLAGRRAAPAPLQQQVPRTSDLFLFCCFFFFQERHLAIRKSTVFPPPPHTAMGPFCLLWTGTFLLVCQATRYTNDWALRIRADPESVDRIARKYGFTNMGQVGAGATPRRTELRLAFSSAASTQFETLDCCGSAWSQLLVQLARHNLFFCSIFYNLR